MPWGPWSPREPLLETPFGCVPASPGGEGCLVSILQSSPMYALGLLLSISSPTKGGGPFSFSFHL